MHRGMQHGDIEMTAKDFIEIKDLDWSRFKREYNEDESLALELVRSAHPESGEDIYYLCSGEKFYYLGAGQVDESLIGTMIIAGALLREIEGGRSRVLIFGRRVDFRSMHSLFQEFDEVVWEYGDERFVLKGGGCGSD